MKAKFFMLLPAVLLFLSLAGWGVMISKATSDRSFAVEPAYYEKAARFDEELARRRLSRELGWRLQVLAFRRQAEGHLALDVQLEDRQGVALDGAELEVAAFSNLKAFDVQTARGLSGDDGRVTLSLPGGPSGLWELRFQAKRGDDLFSLVVRQDLAAAGGKT